MKHRGILFWVTESGFPNRWKWSVGNGHTISVGVCTTREEAIRQARTFIDAIMDWAA